MSSPIEATTRCELYTAILALPDLENANRLIEFQVRLADAIAESESAARTPGFDRHGFLLRRCQDALAFRLLVPHTIRQLLGGASAQVPNLTGQGASFRATLEVAHSYAAAGHLVLVADLSHLIRVGDLIVCDDPFMPSIIEVKSGVVLPQHVMQGRRGRQISRSLTIIDYLKNDHGQIFGQASAKIAVEPNKSMEFSWPLVEEVIGAARHHETAVIRVSDHDVLLAVNTSGGASVSLEPIAADLQRFRSPLIASHAVALLNPDLLIRPPLVWPIDDEAKLLLMEEELILVHAIDLARFMDPLEDDFRILEVSHDRGLATERRGEQGTASARFIHDVLYGYATIESVVAATRDLHDLTKAAFESRSGDAPQHADPSEVEVVSLELPQLERPAVVMAAKNARYRIEWRGSRPK